MHRHPALNSEYASSTHANEGLLQSRMSIDAGRASRFHNHSTLTQPKPSLDTGSGTASQLRLLDWKRKSINSRHSLVRKPDYTMAYSASGKVLPRKLVQPMTSMHDFSNLINSIDVSGEQTADGTANKFHERYRSVDQSQTGSSNALFPHKQKGSYNSSIDY